MTLGTADSNAGARRSQEFFGIKGFYEKYCLG